MFMCNIITQPALNRSNIIMDIYYDEFDYTYEEEAEVSRQLYLGLMMNEIRQIMKEEELKRWWIKITINKKDYLDNITMTDLIEIAERNGIKII